VTQAGRYGGPGGFDPKLVVQGQVADGTPVEFYVDGVRAQCAVPGGPWQESFPFKSGTITELNLEVVGLAATPTLLPTVEPTLTPSPTAGPAVIVPSPTPTPPTPAPGATSTPTPSTMVVATPTSSPPAPSPTPLEPPTAAIAAATPSLLATALPLLPAPTATATSTPSVLPLVPTETQPNLTLPQQQVTAPATVTAEMPTEQATKVRLVLKPVATLTPIPEGTSQSGGIPRLWLVAPVLLIVWAAVVFVVVGRRRIR